MAEITRDHAAAAVAVLRCKAALIEAEIVEIKSISVERDAEWVWCVEIERVSE